MEYIREILAFNLRTLRKEKGLTRSGLAEKVGINTSSYSRYEASGWVGDYEALEKLAVFYGVLSSRFFYDPNLSSDSLPGIITIDQKLKELDIPTREHLEALIDGLLNK